MYKSRITVTVLHLYSAAYSTGPVPDMTYNVFGGTLSLNQSIITVLDSGAEQNTVT